MIYPLFLGINAFNNFPDAFLALKIAHNSKCGSVEELYYENDYSVFTCQKVLSGENKTFEIYIYNRPSDKKEILNEILDFNKRMASNTFVKVSNYFIISETLAVSSDGEKALSVINKEDYDGFDGELLELK